LPKNGQVTLGAFWNEENSEIFCLSSQLISGAYSGTRWKFSE